MHSVALTRGLVAGLALSLALAAVATADDRFPVRSDDNAGDPIINRVAAVDNVLAPLTDRLDRISVNLPPSPVEPLDGALLAIVAQADLLATHTASFAAGCPIGDTEDRAGATIADDDRFAGDASTTGLANQATAIAIVLGTADDRLVRIAGDWFGISPGPPNEPLVAALILVYADAVGLATDADALLGNTYVPPSPVCPSP